MDLIPEASVQVQLNDFNSWSSLNDTIMGGSSQAACRVTSEGLILEGELVEQDGGCGSCRSPLLNPPLDLSSYRALQVEVNGDGRTLTLALGSRSGLFGLTERFYGGLRWVAQLPTKTSGTTSIEIPFSTLKPTVLAQPLAMPLRLIRFDASSINQVQLLHSKFGQPGELNPEFRPGPIRVLLRSIKAIH